MPHPSQDALFASNWGLGKCANINHFLPHCSFLPLCWPGLANIWCCTGPPLPPSELPPPWSFRACHRYHHLDASRDVLTRICSCLHGSSLCPHTKQSWLSLLPSTTKDREELILTCPHKVPHFREDHLTDLFLSPSKHSFSPCSTLFGVRMVPQIGIFVPAVLFFHYFTGTIFLFLFQSLFFPKILLSIASFQWTDTRPSQSFSSPC